MQLAIDLAEVATDADTLINIDLFHICPLKYGRRQPFAAYSILAYYSVPINTSH